MYVQFSSSGLEVNIAERLKFADFQFREFYKHATVSGEALKVGMALLVQIGTHFLDLKVSHITYSPAQSAFMSSWAAELKAFEQSSRGQHLPGSAYNFGKADVTGENTNDVCATCHPDDRLVFFGIQVPVGVNLEKLRM